MATTPLLQRGNGGSTPSGTMGVLSSVEHDGPRVPRRHTSVVGRGTEFDSRADLCLYLTRAAGLTVRRLVCTQEIGVRLPGRSTVSCRNDERRAHGPTGRHQFGRLEIRVRSPVGPLMEGSRIRLAGPLWKGGSPNGDEGSTPLPSARRPDGERDHLRTRRSGFKSWSGYWSRRSAGRTFP